VAAQAQVSGGFELDFNSRYVWRGLASSDGPALQPDAWVTASGFTLNAWANVNLTTQAEQGGIDSASVSLAYEKEYAGFRFTPMVEYWGDRRIAGISDPPSGEFSVNISHAAGPVGVFLLQTVDSFKFRGATYTETGLTKSFTWGKVTIDATLRVGWANKTFFEAYGSLPAGGLLDAGGEVSSNIPIGKGFYLRPHVVWTYLPEARVRAVFRPGSLADAGIALGFSF